MRDPERLYKHEMNLLVPGSWMLCAFFVLLGAALVLYALGLAAIGLWVGISAGLVLAVLLILVAIEQHRDRKLYEFYKSKDPNIR